MLRHHVFEEGLRRVVVKVQVLLLVAYHWLDIIITDEHMLQLPLSWDQLLVVLEVFLQLFLLLVNLLFVVRGNVEEGLDEVDVTNFFLANLLIFFPPQLDLGKKGAIPAS